MTPGQDGKQRRRWLPGLEVWFWVAVLGTVGIAWHVERSGHLEEIAALDEQLAELRGPRLAGWFPARPLAIHYPAHAFAASPDGSQIALAVDRYVDVWDLRAGDGEATGPVSERPDYNSRARCRLSIPQPDVTVDVAISPDGRSLLSIAAGADTPAILWALESGRRIAEFPSPRTQGKPETCEWLDESLKNQVAVTGFGFTSVAFSPDGRRFVAGCDDGTLMLWDVQTGKPLWQKQSGSRRLRRPAFSADGRRLILLSEGGMVQLWDADVGRPLARWPPPALKREQPHCVATSPDSRRAMHASRKTVQFWQYDDATDSRPIRVDEGPAEMVFVDDNETLMAYQRRGICRRAWSQPLEAARWFRVPSFWTHAIQVRYLPRLKAVVLVAMVRDSRLGLDTTQVWLVPLREFREQR